MVDGIPVKLGNTDFIRSAGINQPFAVTGVHVHVALNNIYLGVFKIGNQYREGLDQMSAELSNARYEQHILSGDNDTERNNLEKIFAGNVKMNFEEQPQQKLEYIQQLQLQHRQVMMLGDGLNDAGALKQSTVGIAVRKSYKIHSYQRCYTGRQQCSSYLKIPGVCTFRKEDHYRYIYRIHSL